ncbi:hypothetical protein DSCW_29510 [Desulfosarcina widdelii]|uniref:Uncharacterized protein n=1 Tax=Desulfosarcina widdelii TaxID=947919 RepID=A0A5K7ZAP7_9BACT|nr:hypothetical protein DSCW_29510 [Desulfosarcina widdelii]
MTGNIDSARPEIGKLGRDRGARKILPQTYSGYFEDKIFWCNKDIGRIGHFWIGIR